MGALKIEFEELIPLDAPIEITGFSGQDRPCYSRTRGWSGAAQPTPQLRLLGSGYFQLGPHRIVCGDATDPAVLARLLGGDAPPVSS